MSYKKWCVDKIVIPIIVGLISGVASSTVFWCIFFQSMKPSITISDIITKKIRPDGSVRYLIKVESPRGNAIDVKITAILMGNVKNPEITWKFFYSEKEKSIPTPKILLSLSNNFIPKLYAKGERGEPGGHRIELKIGESVRKVLLKKLQFENIPVSDLKEKLTDTAQVLKLEELLRVFDYVKVEVIADHSKSGLSKYFSRNIDQYREERE